MLPTSGSSLWRTNRAVVAKATGAAAVRIPPVTPESIIILRFPDGVALAAIQELKEKVEGRMEKAEAVIHELKTENAELRARPETLEQLIS